MLRIHYQSKKGRQLSYWLSTKESSKTMKVIRYTEIIFTFLVFLLVMGVAFSDTYFQVPTAFFLPIIDIEKHLWPIYLTFCFLLIAITLYEVNFLRILDIFTLPGIIIALVLSYFFDNTNLLSHALGIMAGGAPLYIAAVVYLKATNKDGIGGGVIKLAAMIGAFLGVFNVIVSLVITTAITIPYFFIGYRLKGKDIVEVGPLLSIVSLTTVILPYDKLIRSIIN
jgi:prepilin signal peptidase PulO-like enzyme (type II secretory pathway)